MIGLVVGIVRACLQRRVWIAIMQDDGTTGLQVCESVLNIAESLLTCVEAIYQHQLQLPTSIRPWISLKVTVAGRLVSRTSASSWVNTFCMGKAWSHLLKVIT